MVIFGITAFMSCEKSENIENDTNTNTLLLKSATNVGTIHNDGLNYVFNALKEMDVKNNTDLHDTIVLFDIVISSTISYINTSEYSNDFDESAFDLTIAALPYNVIKSINEYSILELLETEIELSQLQIIYITELDSIFDNTNFESVDAAIIKISDMEYRIVSNCETEEAELLLVMTSVAINSLNYWNDNLENWIIELAGGTLNLKSEDSDWFWETLGDMGKSDLVSAGIGACVGGLPGAAAGACYGPAGRGIVALADYWGLW